MNRLLGLGIILILLVGCQQETNTGIVGQQFVLKADIPDEVGTFDYVWKITDLPETSELIMSDIQFSEDESQAIFVPDVTGHFTIKVTVWKHNDKLGALVYKYNIIETTPELTAQQQSRDDWLNETVEEPLITKNVESTMEENDTATVEEIVAEKPSSVPVQKPIVIVEEPAVTKVQQTAITEVNYTIQVAAEPNSDAAVQHVNRLIDAGYDAYSLKHTTADNKTLYRIRIGKYAARETALQAANKIANDQGLPTWVTQYQK